VKKDDPSGSGSARRADRTYGGALGSGSGTEDPFVLLPRATSNSRLVREVDPRASRDLWLLLILVVGFAGGMVLYAWPRLQAHHIDSETQQNQRHLEQLVEANRKLRLDKASLERLDRIEQIATRELGLATPEPSRTFVVERPAPPATTRLARAPEARETERVN
jgi:cell division protein FtsL